MEPWPGGRRRPIRWRDWRVADVTSRVERIAAATQQVSVSTARVHEEVAEVASIAEQSSDATVRATATTARTAEAAETLVGSAHELAAVAAELGDLVARFEV